jgi:hypothetical protein
VHAAVGHEPEEVQPPPDILALMICFLMTSFAPSLPSATSTSMRLMSVSAMRPAPKFRWPTSLLPICPTGNPTSGPLVPIVVCG